MKNKLTAATTYLFLLSSLLLWAGEPWKDKPYTSWTIDDVGKVLKDSPWASKVTGGLPGASSAGPLLIPRNERPAGYRTVPITDPGTGGTGVQHVPIYAPGSGASGASGESRTLAGSSASGSSYFALKAVWFSSLTVRQALVRRLQLGGARDQKALEQFLMWKPEHYVIAIIGPATMEFTGIPADSLLESSYLELKPDGRKIAAAKVEFLPEPLFVREVRFHFQKVMDGKPVIAPGQRKGEFHCQGRRKIKATFDLRKMVRDGKPDL